MKTVLLMLTLMTLISCSRPVAPPPVTPIPAPTVEITPAPSVDSSSNPK